MIRVAQRFGRALSAVAAVAAAGAAPVVLSALLVAAAPGRAEASPAAQSDKGAAAPQGTSTVQWDPWYVLAPIDQPGGAKNVATPTPVEDELARMLPGRDGPDLSRVFQGKGGVVAAWREVRDEDLTAPVAALGALDLTRLATKDAAQNEASAYVYRRVRVKEAQVVVAKLGYDDAARVWLNGKLVADGSIVGAYEPMSDQLELELAPGDNHLFAKVTNAGGAWKFRLLPLDSRPLAGRAAAQLKVNRAIERGCEYLISRQSRDGSWGFDEERFPGGMTALAVYALVKSGISPRHQAVQRGVANLRGRATEHTYTAGCVLLMLWTLHDDANHEWAADVTDELLSWNKSGVWGYPDDQPDLSNTQYAVLGLLAASRMGIEVPSKVWREIIDKVGRYQGKSGGFGYRIGDTGAPTGSMTAAGLSAIAIARSELAAQAGKGAQGLSLAEPFLAAGARWLTDHFQITGSPSNTPGERPNVQRGPYYLYGVERACTLLGLDRLGAADWYWEGANWFLEAQGSKGEFATAYGEEEPNTAFGLLFLARATGSFTGQATSRKENVYQTEDEKSDVFVRGAGNAELALWLGGFAPRVENDFAWRRPESKGLHVALVEYVVDGEVMARVPGDASKPWRGDKYAAQLAFTRGGVREVRARVHLMLEPAQAGGDPESHVLESAPFTLDVVEVVGPWMLEQATAARRNVFSGQEVRASASTQFSDSPAQRAVDGRESTGWTSLPEDKQPLLTLELGRPQRASAVVLSPLGGRAESTGEWDRATRVEIRINKTDPPIAAELDTDELRTTRVEFGKALMVRTLEIRVLERATGKRFPGRVGFNEVLLLHDAGRASKGPAGKDR